jgi:hypothetical protein
MSPEVEKSIHTINNYIISTGAVVADILGGIVHTEGVTVYGIGLLPAEEIRYDKYDMELITLGDTHHTFPTKDIKTIKQTEQDCYVIEFNNMFIVLKG